MIRKLILGASALAFALTASTAFAADLPMADPPMVSVPSFSWTGLYFGAQAGYSFGKSKDDLIGQKFRPKGGVFGAYLGYNYQFDNSPVVVGVETDFNYTDVNDKKNLLSVPGLLTINAKNDTNWAGATRARVGYAFGNFLLYGAGGIAYVRREASININVVGIPIKFEDKKWDYGYTIGGGAEYAVTNNILARIDYRYNDFGKTKFNFGVGSVKADLTEHRVMAGVAYKFD